MPDYILLDDVVDEMLDNMPFIWTPIHFDNSKYLLQSIYGNHYNAF